MITGPGTASAPGFFVLALRHVILHLPGAHLCAEVTGPKLELPIAGQIDRAYLGCGRSSPGGCPDYRLASLPLLTDTQEGWRVQLRQRCRRYSRVRWDWRFGS